MPSYFTTYWRPDGFSGLAPGDSLQYAAASGFAQRGVKPGSRVYVVNTSNGALRLLGAFTVGEITDRSGALAKQGYAWPAPEHLIAQPGTASAFAIRAVPTSIAKSLQFVTADGLASPKFDADGNLDRQTLRGVRELASPSALLLEQLLDAADEGEVHEATALPTYGNSGAMVKATFTVSPGDGYTDVILQSRGGTIGAASERNPEYSTGLKLLLGRLARLNAVLLDALVESAALIKKGLSPADRRVVGLNFPIPMGPGLDVPKLAGQLQRGQAGVGSDRAGGGGNSTRRLLLRVKVDAGLDELVEALAVGDGPASVPRGLGPIPNGRAAETADFDPSGLMDARRRIERSLALREGQPRFRKELLAAYAFRCCISECDLEEALEAAHIVPYLGPTTNHVQNGLLLRSDLHTLFDRGLFGVDPVTMEVKIDPRLKGTQYGYLADKTLRLPTEAKLRPSTEALAAHLEALPFGGAAA